MKTQKVKQKILPLGWPFYLGICAAAAVAGNLLVRIIPWPDTVLSGYSGSVQAMRRETSFLFLTLVAAPVLEEAVFRLGLYGFLRCRMGFWLAAVLSSLAFGLYHGNWIQGTCACLVGMVLAWGYEKSPCQKYIMAVLMHGTANLAVLAVFG